MLLSTNYLFLSKSGSIMSYKLLKVDLSHHFVHDGNHRHHCGLSGLPTSLSELHLDGNKITKMTAGSLEGLKNLAK